MSYGVCMYSPYPTGGMPLYVAELLEAMASAPDGGPNVEWLSSTDLDPRFASDNYTVHRVLPAIRDVGEFRTGLGRAVSRAAHYFRRERRFMSWLRERPDIGAVHFQEVPPAILHLLSYWLKRRRTAVFVTVHNVQAHNYPFLLPRSLVDRSLRRAYTASDSLFVHSQGLADELERFLGLDGERTPQTPRICVVPHGLWTVGSGVPAIDVQTICRRFHDRRLLFFGTIRRNKGLHLLLEAAASRELEGFSLTVAGEPGEPDYMEDTVLPLVARARAAGMPVDLRAEFVPDDEIAALCAAHGALILPYTDDFVAQSGIAFMGLAHGLPLVATRSGALGELMAGRSVGVTAKAATAAAVAEAVHNLFSMAGRDVADLAEGLRRAAEELTWGGMATATIAEYRRSLPRISVTEASGVPTGGTSCAT